MKKKRVDGSNTRHERLREIVELAKTHVGNNEGMMSLKVFLARVDWELGLSPRTATGYLETLRNLEVLDFDVRGDFITMGNDTK